MFRVYVDEAGNRTISPKSDRYFVASAVIVHDDGTSGSFNEQCRAGLASMKPGLGRRPHHVLHFNKLKKHRREPAAQAVAALPLARIVNVIICKDLIGQERAPGQMSYLANPDPMYLWALRLLLERVSWYARDHQRQDTILTFSHVRGLNPQLLHSYRRALEQAPPEKDVRIEWPLLANHPFRVASPATVDLLQLADTTASSVFQAVEPGKDGPAYVRALRPQLMRGAGPITTYGLKVFPARAACPAGPLHWLRAL